MKMKQQVRDALGRFIARRMKKVLIVEDDDTARIALTLLLQRMGYGVTSACYGGEMLAMMDGIDAVVTDVNMPHLDGVAATNIAKHIMDMKIPFIAMTGLALSEVPKDVFNHILPKPLQVADLIGILREI
jgi:CheY-like chemotaxis protein